MCGKKETMDHNSPHRAKEEGVATKPKETNVERRVDQKGIDVEPIG